MDKLTTEHLASYLPYGLCIANKSLQGNIISTYKMELNNNNDRGIENVLFGVNQIPILRPLSDLTTEIEHNGEKFVPIEWFEIGDEENESLEFDHGNIKIIRSLESLSKVGFVNDISYLPYAVVIKLLSWHFDVFGLREKNLCIYYDELKEAIK